MTKKRYQLLPYIFLVSFFVLTANAFEITLATSSTSESTKLVNVNKDSSSGGELSTRNQDAQGRDSKSQNSFQPQTGLSLDVQVDFGKAKYGDSDGNGFDNATILGYGLNAVWDLPGSWSLWANFNNLNSYDALTVYPGYEILDPTVTGDEKGILTNTVLAGGISYRFVNLGIFDQMQLGIGWLNFDFIAKEHGFLETRDYQGIEGLLRINKKLNDRISVQGAFMLAPMLTVNDKVKGDVNDPDRTANTSYRGYYWGTQWGLRIALNDKTWLESGFNYQWLHGEGHEHPDYRFLEHDYQEYGFYTLLGIRFNSGSGVTVQAQPETKEPLEPAPDVQPSQISPSVIEKLRASEPASQTPVVVISKVTPNEGLTNTKVNLAIEGAGFRPDTKIVLSKDQITLPTNDLVIISGTRISCSLDLKDAAIGVYDVSATNDDGQTSKISNAFAVKQPEQANHPTPAVTASSSEGFSNGSILITFKGAGFVPGTTVKMTGPAGAVVKGEIVKVQPDAITGFFNLKGQSEGSYDVIMTYPDGHSAQLPEGFKVKAFSENNSRTLTQVYFDVGKATINTDQIRSIKDKLAELLKNPKAKIILGGYTDARGSISYNLILSMRRAEAVKTILIASGIDPKQIDIYAYGKQKAKQGLNENVWRNDRRVDIVIYQEN